MGMTLALVAAAITLGQPPQQSRYEMGSPLPSLPSLMLDTLGDGYGLAQQAARGKGLQARIMWVDGTANLDKVSSDSKVHDLVARIKSIGFNTIVFDVKPIVGYTLYPSKLTDKLEKWRELTFPKDFDPLKAMVRECRAAGLALYASMNVFSEGHRFTKTGPGYDKRELQTVQYIAQPLLSSASDPSTSWPIQKPQPTETQNAETIYLFDRLPIWDSHDRSIYGCIVDPKGKVLDVLSNSKVPAKIPEGAVLYYAIGRAGEWLSKHGQRGMRIKLTSKPILSPIAENQTQWPLMMNPHRPENQDRALSFVKEILSNYDVNGIVFDDRLRFGALNADFSEYSHQLFEKYVGQSVQWPEDIYTSTFTPALKQGIRPGKWFDAWLAWRAQTVKYWIETARKVVNQARPGAQLGVYAGSWYGDYPQFGNNYASPQLQAGFAFLTNAYRKTGFANSLDFLITGCYYKLGTVVEAMEKGAPTGPTVEAAGQLTNRLAREQCWAIAGIKLDDFYGDLGGLQNALQGACASTQGVMVFDYSHKFDDFEPTLRQAFAQPANSPIQSPSLLTQIRKTRASLDKMKAPEMPVWIREGTPGSGF